MAKAKVIRVNESDGSTFRGWMVWCPGCEGIHVYDKRWTFNGDYDKPTFHPSFNSSSKDRTGKVRRRCHSWLRDGKLQFLPDCTHKLAGKTVDIPEEFE